MRRFRTSLTAALIGAALVAAPGPAHLEAADPFYESLLREGKRALAAGDLADAILELEIACFGLLDEPTLLAEGLAHLAVAQSLSGDRKGLDESLDRLLEVERRHEGFSRSGLSPETRQAVEQVLLARVALDRLSAIEAFRPLAQQRDLEVLMATRPARRREILQQRLARNPQDFQALQLLAELELSQGNATAALPYLDTLVEASGGDRTAVCRRFRAAVETGSCSRTLQDLEACPVDAAEPGPAETVLGCLIDARRLAEASGFVESLPAEARDGSRLRKLERRLDKEVRAASRRQVVADAPPLAPSEAATKETASAQGGSAEGAAQEAAGDPREAPATVAGSAPEALGPASETADPCLAMRTAALQGRCPEALAERAVCPEVAAEPQVATALGKCYARAGEWAEIRTFLASLPPQVAGLPKLRKLGRKAAKELNRLEGGAALASAEIGEADQAAASGVVEQQPASGSAAEAAPEPAVTAPEAPSPDGQLAELRRQLDAARTPTELHTALTAALRLAAEHPGSSRAQFLAAEAAYRAARWQQAVRLFDAGGDPGNAQPLLLFYKAVALFEIGDAVDAASYLERALPGLQKTAFVESYRARIMAAVGDPG